jgi:hypothetical protein
MNLIEHSGAEIGRGEKLGLGKMGLDRGALVVDISRSRKPLKFRKETLFVNASIMD